MKRALFTLTLAAVCSLAMAQQGSFYIGGVAGFASLTSKPPTGTGSDVSSIWVFAPEAGTFLQDDIQVGLALGLSGSTDKDNGTKEESSISISPTLYARKFFKITDAFSTFAGLYLNFTSATTKDFEVTPTTEFTSSGFGARIGIGVAYALSPRFTAVGQYGLLGFQTMKFKAGDTDLGSSSLFDFGVNTVGDSSLGQGNLSGSVFNVGLYYTFMP